MSDNIQTDAIGRLTPCSNKFIRKHLRELLTTLGMNDWKVNTIVDIISNLQGKILLDSLKEFVRVTTSLDFLEAPEAYLDGLILKTKEIYDSIPDIDAEFLNTGARKLGEAMAAVLSGEIKVNYSGFQVVNSNELFENW